MAKSLESSAQPPAPAGAAPARLKREETPRFHIFFIDSGWNTIASRVLHENAHLISNFNRDDPCYFLDHDTSVELLRTHTSLIGSDPIISVHDMHAIRDTGPGARKAHGFRLHLGQLHSEVQVMSALQ